jgi:hypothetical protein
VALEENYRVYRETIAIGLQILRPDIKAETATLEALEKELERFDPKVVICSGHEKVESEGIFAWIELSLDPTQPTKISVSERYLERTNPTLKELIETINEFE